MQLLDKFIVGDWAERIFSLPHRYTYPDLNNARSLRVECLLNVQMAMLTVLDLGHLKRNGDERGRGLGDVVSRSAAAALPA